MGKVNFVLDGKQAEAEKGCTILEAARHNGIEVPTLCHDTRLKPTAACRICLVSVQGARGPLPACATPLTEGMVVSTETAELFKTRQMALELMLSDHYGDCVAPCKLACPAGIDIQGYIGLIANGLYHDALKLIKESNPLPLICGRVCPRFCEQQCRRTLVDSPVSINALKRFASDYALSSGVEYLPQVKPPTGCKVAIIGGGPAGLSAAYFLALEGHSISILDSNPELGGMMRYGIPAYRLPRDILNREIEGITRLCYEVRCNTTFGKDFDIDSLLNDGYKAIFLAMGAQADQRMGVDGENLPGVYSGIGFLRDVALGNKVNLGQRVAVIGGGNTAIDAAQTAVRLGCKHVTIVYRRTRDEMPASPDEIKQAEDKGVEFCFLAAPLKLGPLNGHVQTIQCIRMQLGEPDSSGRRKPEPVAGSEFIIEADNVISAIGQSMKMPQSNAVGKLEINRRNYFSINEFTMQTSLAGVFAGGDCTSGPATVVEAVAAGHRAAISINQYLQGQEIVPPKKHYNCSKGRLDEIDAEDYSEVQRIPRVEMPSLDPNIKLGFDEFELGFTENMALIEAGRCLACGCQKAFDCTLRDLATKYEVDARKYNGRKHKRPIDDHEHPNILRDTNKCILCGRCVRICNEVAAIGAYGFVNRGFETVVEPALGLPLQQTNCNSCGLCITTCPTGAILPKVDLIKPGPWKLDTAQTVCPGCSVGCNIILNYKGDKIVKITSPISAQVNGGNLCKKGIFISDSINGIKRLKKPFIARGGKLVETSWDEALETAARGLLNIREQKGGDKIAVLASPQLTNEEAYLTQKIARAALSTNNIGCLTIPPPNAALLKHLGKDGSTCNYQNLQTSDLIIVYNCELEQNYPVAALKVREAVAQGSRLITLGPRQSAIDLMANISLKVNRRTSTEVLSAILSYIAIYDMVDHKFISQRVSGYQDLAAELKLKPLEKFNDIPWVNPSKLIEAIQLYVRATKPVILIDGDNITTAEAAAVSQLALITGNIDRDGAGILVLRSQCNAQGLIDMGVSPDYLPGQVPLNSSIKRDMLESAWKRVIPSTKGLNTIELMESIAKGGIEGALLVGKGSAGENGNAIFGSSIFSVLIDTVLPEKPPYPSVVLPAAIFAESDGTFTNSEGRVQSLNPAFASPGGKKNWEILAQLSNLLGYNMQYPSASLIAKEITKMVLNYSGEDAVKHTHLTYPTKFVVGCGV